MTFTPKKQKPKFEAKIFRKYFSENDFSEKYFSEKNKGKKNIFYVYILLCSTMISVMILNIFDIQITIFDNQITSNSNLN